LIKIITKEENFKWHLEAFASELFICSFFPYGIDVKIVASENAEWLVTLENQ